MRKKTRKIIVAKRAGFCFGVRRAVDLAVQEAKNHDNEVFCLGDLIHNPRVISDLKKMGVKTVENLKRISSGGTLIIRSHGVVPEVFEEAKKRKINVVDATCPFVKNAQKIASDFEKEGRQVIIFGDSKHSEVIGIRGYAKKAIIVQDEKEAKKLKNFSRVGVLAQTTQKPDVFQKILKEIENKTEDMRAMNTICLDSFEKKKEAQKISEEVDLMIVIGGKNSNNTKKLAEVSRASGAKTYHIEIADELKEEWFENVKKIGIAAGASTPDESIDNAVKKIKTF